MRDLKCWFLLLVTLSTAFMCGGPCTISSQCPINCANCDSLSHTCIGNPNCQYACTGDANCINSFGSNCQSCYFAVAPPGICISDCGNFCAIDQDCNQFTACKYCISSYCQSNNIQPRCNEHCSSASHCAPPCSMCQNSLCKAPCGSTCASVEDCSNECPQCVGQSSGQFCTYVPTPAPPTTSTTPTTTTTTPTTTTTTPTTTTTTPTTTTTT